VTILPAAFTLRRDWRLLVLAVCCVLATVALATTPAISERLQAPAAAGSLVAGDEASALAAARAQGRQVEALSDRSEYSQTFANPSGTLTLQESVAPVRARRSDGSWAPVDTTLRFQSDGRVAPVATVADVSFSPGGTGPLARIARDGSQLTLGWPGGLPRPELSGDSATYREVLPGVDLRVNASALGFSDLLVVRTREAALNPALAMVRLAIAVSGVTLLTATDGTQSAVDAYGQEVFGAPAPSMWDASGLHSPVGLRIHDGEMDLVPDQAMLTRASTRFPLSIDPDYHVKVTGRQEAWTKVNDCQKSQTYWNGTNDSDSEKHGSVKVGHSPTGYGDPCDGATWRSYFRMDTSAVAGTNVFLARFHVFNTYAASCNPKPIDLYWSGSVYPSTDWNTQPGFGAVVHGDFAHGWHAGLPGGCNPGSEAFDVGWAVWTTANNRGSMITLMLKAPDENPCVADSTGDFCEWKKFDSGALYQKPPYLEIEYDTAPNVPTDLYTDGSGYLYPNGRIPCDSGTHLVNTTTPRLHATISDPDDHGSSQPQPLTATYSWSWTDASGTGHSGSASDAGHPGPWATTTTIPANELAGGETVKWSVWAYDQIQNGPTSPTCSLTVDTTPQTQLPGVISTDGKYPVGGAGTVVGTPGQFTFDPGGATDMAGYLYGLNTSTPWRFVPATGPGNTATVTIVPPVVGPNSLAVRIIGLSGNLGPVQSYDVVTTHPTGSTSVLLGQWNMDEGSGSVVHDSTGGHDGTAAGTLAWAAGHTGAPGDRAIDLSSSAPGGHVTNGEPAVDTRFGYTVSAWVKLADTGGSHTVVSQEGASGGAFYLEYYAPANRWAFSVPVTDGNSPAIVHAISDVVPQAGVWTHLVGVYCDDVSCLGPNPPAAGRLYLYVDVGGVLQLQSSQPAFTSPWMGTGAIDIGRGLYNGAYSSNLNGTVDDVSMYWGDPCPSPATATTCGIP
jgi:hypothetical protein